MGNIINNLTKRLEKFVYNFENHTFVRKIERFLNLVYRYTEMAGGYVIMGASKLVFYYNKLNKYANGKRRIKNFLITNICDFEKEHKIIVLLIDTHCIEEERNWEKYLKSKHRVSSILRANRRMRSFKILTDDEEMKSYLNEYINRTRFTKKYELSTELT